VELTTHSLLMPILNLRRARAQPAVSVCLACYKTIKKPRVRCMEGRITCRLPEIEAVLISARFTFAGM